MKQQTQRQQTRLWDETYYQTMAIENNQKHTKQQLPTNSVRKSTTNESIENITPQEISTQDNNNSFMTPTDTNH